MYSAEQAEVLALKALQWLSAQDAIVMAFLSETGAGVEDMHTQADNPEFLASVIDFILMNEMWVKDFCDTAHLPYHAIQSIRMALPGGDLPHWT